MNPSAPRSANIYVRLCVSPVTRLWHVQRACGMLKLLCVACASARASGTGELHDVASALHSAQMLSRPAVQLRGGNTHQAGQRQALVLDAETSIDLDALEARLRARMALELIRHPLLASVRGSGAIEDALAASAPKESLIALILREASRRNTERGLGLEDALVDFIDALTPHSCGQCDPTRDACWDEYEHFPMCDGSDEDSCTAETGCKWSWSSKEYDFAAARKVYVEQLQNTVHILSAEDPELVKRVESALYGTAEDFQTVEEAYHDIASSLCAISRARYRVCWELVQGLNEELAQELYMAPDVYVDVAALWEHDDL